MTHTNFSKHKDIKMSFSPVTGKSQNIYSITEEGLITPIGLITSITEGLFNRELVQRFRRAPLTLQVLAYIYQRGAATALIIRHRLKLSKSSVHYILNRLYEEGYIRPVSTTRGTGRPAKVWVPIGKPDPEKVKEAILEHQRLSSPKYQLAEQYAQQIFDKYLKPRKTTEISYKEVLIIVKDPDLAHITCWVLQRQYRARVWR